MNDIENRLCPKVEAAFVLLSKKWTGLILFSLGTELRCFNELEAAIPGISARLLSLRIRELEEAGLVQRQVRTDILPLRVAYRLTERGGSLAEILNGIADWAKN
jgi:DNA-binding HxlR family transcriptional regulator